MSIVIVALVLLLVAAVSIHQLVGDHRREICLIIQEKVRLLQLAHQQLQAAFKQRIWLPEEAVVRATVADQLDAVAKTLSDAAQAVPEGYYGASHTKEQLTAIEAEVDKALAELNRIRRQVRHPYADEDEENENTK